jgi:predicted  nucleic acid-binding Zn-ribbon protein
MEKLFSLKIDVSKRALKVELEEIENKCLNASNDVPTAEIQNQISMLEGRINSTNDYMDKQNDTINELMVRYFFFNSLLIANLKSIYISSD